MAEFKLPTEIIDLPSQGKLYPEGHPLKEGKVEMKYMTAREEDILTNQSYIQKGVVLDKLIQSLLVTEFDYQDLLTGDKNALMVAARVLGYGKDYTFVYQGEEHNVDLTSIEAKPIHPDIEKASKNEFEFTLPKTGTQITFQLLTHKIEREIARELEGLQKVNPNSSPEVSTRFKYIITSVNGSREKKDIREFVDNYLLAADSRELRKHIQKITPDVDLTFFPEPGAGKVNIPIGLKFFWPDF